MKWKIEDMTDKEYFEEELKDLLESEILKSRMYSFDEVRILLKLALAKKEKENK